MHRAAVRAGTAAALAAGLVGCTAATPRTPVPTPTAARALTDGAYYVLVQQADPSRSALSVHVVQFFTGAAAAHACAQDGVPDQRGALCHDYYIRDRGSRQWTIAVAPGAQLVIRAEGCGPARSVRLRDIATELGRHRLFRLRVDKGVGTALDETCTP